MALAGLRQVSITFGGVQLLDDAELQIEENERICLLGRNGSGKSTLLRLLNGDLKPDSGTVEHQQGSKVAILPQKVPQDLEGKVYDLVASGLGKRGELLSKFHEISQQLAENGDDQKLLNRLDRVHHELDARDGWSVHQQVETVISRLKLDPEDKFRLLSGGMKRRVLLARALVYQPDLLLLDEPTNHLDLDSITWLEEFLKNYSATILFVTHDRRFLKNVATRIVELDRGQLTSWDCDYETYLERKEAALEAEEKQWKNFEKKLAREEEWMRRTPKARKQRNMGRVRKLQEMRDKRRNRRERVGQAKMELQDAERSGKKVIEAKNITFSYGNELIIKDFSTLIMRGDKIGIVGPNGSGKTTLIKLLLGELDPDQGTVKHGTRLEVAYFDQHRAQFDEEKSVFENVAEGKNIVEINGRKRHAVGYLEDFLFTKDRAKSPVKVLSGGERNRLLLARLFAEPSNVLVMDEPTNDLDTETLELLEEKMVDYDGTILLVSHDRQFLNNVVTSTMIMEGNGRVKEYIGGYDDWVEQRQAEEKSKREAEEAKSTAESKSKQNGSQNKKSRKKSKERKLTYKERKELNALPARIEKLEAEQQELYDAMSDPSFYQQDEEDIMETRARLDELDRELEEIYDRWEELEALDN